MERTWQRNVERVLKYVRLTYMYTLITTFLKQNCDYIPDDGLGADEEKKMSDEEEKQWVVVLKGAFYEQKWFKISTQ